MADVNFPSMSELQIMGGLDFPQFQQAQERMGLASQFANQNLAMGQEDLRTKALANMFSEQANPLRINQLGLQNEGMGYENTTKRVQAETDDALKEENIMAKRQKMLADLDENKLKQFMSRAEMEMMSDDPRLQQSGQKKIMMSKAELERRLKQQDELAKIAAQGQNSKDVANIQAGATLGAARIGADSRASIAAAKAKIDPSSEQAIEAALNKIPTAKGKHAALVDAATRFGLTDPDKAAYFMSRAAALRPQAEAEIASGRPPGIDVPQVAGLPAAPGPNIAPSRAVGGAVGQPAQPVAKPPSTLADVSKMYPGVPPEKLRDAYKKKFGVELK